MQTCLKGDLKAADGADSRNHKIPYRENANLRRLAIWGAHMTRSAFEKGFLKR